HGIAEVLQAVFAQLLWSGVAGVIELGLRGNDLVEQFALAVMAPSLDVGLAQCEGFAEGSAALGGNNHHACARRALQDQLPLLGAEVGLPGHGVLLSSSHSVALEHDHSELRRHSRVFRSALSRETE